MIAHLLIHPLGLAHVLTALAAMLFGSAVMLTRKGTRRHSWLGRAYVVMMIALNVTALMDYELFGRFGPFHWMALMSLATIVVGYMAAFRRGAGWRVQHAYFMAGSYVGLMAAAVAEVAARVPGWQFAASVSISSAIVIVIGVVWMRASIPALTGGSIPASRR